ncbi:MAG: hypothetical protein HN413_13300 [Chloroflexi bacterium]|jgi:hypothetical protein|nr:hypothetical protein [Chloroflexota bacterium]
MSVWVMIGLLLLGFPKVISPDCTEQALYLDPVSQAWQFTGQIENSAHYALPGVGVDLAQVSFPRADGGRNHVWVTTGLHFWSGSDRDYIPLGPWSTPAEWESVQAAHPRVHVVVDLAHSDPQVQQFAHSDLVISAQFIASGGHAPNWYPWGFVFGTLSPQSCEAQQSIHSIQFMEE